MQEQFDLFKKIKIHILIVGVFIFISSCEKHEFEYIEPYIKPIIVTDTITKLTSNSAICVGKVIYPEHSKINKYGIFWGLDSTFNTNHNFSINAKSDSCGYFTDTLFNLNTKTNYYYRAFAISEKNDTVYGNAKSIYIAELRQNYQGGIVFYIDESGKHGIIAAEFDQSTGVRWDYNDTINPTGARKTGVFQGMNNTNKIISRQGSGNYAASICNNLVLNGYADWCLPTIDELYFIRKNLRTYGIGNLNDSVYYWSSTENADQGDFMFNAASSYDMYNNAGSYNDKKNMYSVRAIRYF